MRDHHLIEAHIRDFSLIKLFFLVDRKKMKDEDNIFWRQVLSTIRKSGSQASVSTSDQWASRLGSELTIGTLNIKYNLEDIWNQLFNMKKRNHSKQEMERFFQKTLQQTIKKRIEKEKKEKNQTILQPFKPRKKNNAIIVNQKKDLPSEYFQDNILKENHVYIDPNKRDLLYCLGWNDDKLRYTQMQRRHESRSKHYEFIRNKLENDNKLLTKQDVYEKNGLKNFNLPIPSRKLLDPVAYNLYLRLLVP
ncbi:hypothetical protein HDU92_008254, partial [Lobulomyces angularis]